MSQTSQLYELLSDGKPHRTDEIADKIYSGGSLARVGARINDLAAGRWPGKKKCEFIDQFGNLLGLAPRDPKGWKDKQNPKLYWYRMKVHYPVDNGTIDAYIPAPDGWHCSRPGCTMDVKHIHTTFASSVNLPPAFEPKPTDNQPSLL